MILKYFIIFLLHFNMPHSEITHFHFMDSKITILNHRFLLKYKYYFYILIFNFI